jgi:hypothetical protein
VYPIDPEYPTVREEACQYVPFHIHLRLPKTYESFKLGEDGKFIVLISVFTPFLFVRATA